MEGEKVSGDQVAQAAEVASRELGLCVDCVTAVPVRRDGKVPYYALLVAPSTLADLPVPPPLPPTRLPSTVSLPSAYSWMARE